MTLTIATIDMHGFNRRIQKSDIEGLAVVLKSEQVEVLTVQGITRYPTVRSRIDFVEELARIGEMRKVFGETMNLSGRQYGNALFSIYPIRSSRNIEYAIKGANFESALQVTVDAGVKDAVVVSTRLPERASNRELAACVQDIIRIHRSSGDSPFVVAGNLPQSANLRNPELFSEALEATGETTTRTSRLWYVDHETFKLLRVRKVETSLGLMTVAQFGLFARAPQ